MSQENVEIVRRPLRVRERSSRTLEQKLFVRFPRLANTSLRLLSRLAPTSPVRRALMRRGAQLAVEAFNRRDLEALSTNRYADFEIYPPPEMVEGGFMEPSYSGDAGFHKYVSEVSDVWGDGMRVEPVELIDLGDRFVILYNLPVRAQASGVPFTEQFASVGELKNGKVIRQHEYLDHTEALEAVGLRE